MMIYKTNINLPNRFDIDSALIYKNLLYIEGTYSFIVEIEGIEIFLNKQKIGNAEINGNTIKYSQLISDNLLSNSNLCDIYFRDADSVFQISMVLFLTNTLDDKFKHPDISGQDSEKDSLSGNYAVNEILLNEINTLSIENEKEEKDEEEEFSILGAMIDKNRIIIKGKARNINRIEVYINNQYIGEADYNCLVSNDFSFTEYSFDKDNTIYKNSLNNILSLKFISEENRLVKTLNKTIEYIYTDESNEQNLRYFNSFNNGLKNSYDNKFSISIIIPVKNAGDNFSNLLRSIRNQKGFKDIEIVIVDSGSTDNSLLAAESFNSKIIRIAPEEFSHSEARNLGAKESSNPYIFFTVQDALLPHDFFLFNLFRELINNDCAAVSALETPNKDVDLFYLYNLYKHNSYIKIGNNNRICYLEVNEDDSIHNIRIKAQLSNVACLMERNTFLEYTFRHNYAEDLDLGIRLLKDHRRIGLLGKERIIHSHNRTAYSYFKRGYLEIIEFSKIIGSINERVYDFNGLINLLFCVAAFFNKFYHQFQEINNISITDFKNQVDSFIDYFEGSTEYKLDNDFIIKYMGIDYNNFIDEFVKEYGTGENIVFDNENIVKSNDIYIYLKSYLTGLINYLMITKKTVNRDLLENIIITCFKEFGSQYGIFLARTYLSNNLASFEKFNNELLEK